MGRPTRRAIEEQDKYLLGLQARFRRAADAATAALAKAPEVEAVVLIGSVAQPLRREVPRFRPFRHLGIPIWHECKDVDLAVWVDRLDRLRELSRIRSSALNRLLADEQLGVAQHQVEIFLLRTGSNDYLGRLCIYSTCPKGKRDCLAPGCGRELFLRQHQDFAFWPETLNEDRVMRLYQRGKGILRLAADTPAVGREDEGEVEAAASG